jgi:ABC-type nitrate/sulfonate/bicarbonate transport system permease component
MAENQACGKFMGFLLIAIPIFALIFGSDEPAMQTDNAAIVMTGMIFFGIIMMANSSKNKTKSTTPIQMQRRDIRTSSVERTFIPQSSSTMTHGNTTGTQVITRVLVVCPYCGSKNEQGILKCQNCSAEL